MPVDHEAQATQRLTDIEDIFRVLKLLELHRSLITVTLPEVNGVASSMVIEVDLEQGHFVIDQLNEKLLQSKIKTGVELVFRAAYGGVQVSGEARVLTLNQDDLGLRIVLALPNRVLHRQRRAAFRASVTSEPVHISLQSDQREPLEGWISDVSIDGLGVVFDKFVHPPIQPSELFTNAQFTANNHSFTQSLVAKHPNYDKMTDKYRCGFSFYKLTPADEKRINQWVIQLQRHHRKSHRLSHPRPAKLGNFR
ncbi:flagellar brake protein [Simiduia aestuariiviva]|uniref:C-di-GMP-binding flagellar brake protein YcgR n=1 Tax=Simiduia aestuariiviva TaxID=1510459 RepID=A0A839URG3_9GAMM|nr:flagellar brake protein [Simiduia aestuariiviva]MBB3168456.1 c-di-GMP-binding flagellar brake protein YcgR [Simiduia aestuariiviva]